jgi:O-antigen/teichoic acid export membrane protein
MQLKDKYFDILVSYCLKGFIPLIGFTGWLYYSQSLFQSLSIMSLLYITIIFFYDKKRSRSYFPSGIVMKDAIVILKECFPITLSPLIVTFMLFLTRNSVEYIYGTTELGYYSAVTMIIAVILTIAWAVYYVLLPVIADKYKKCLKRDIIRIVLIVLGVILVATLLLFLMLQLIGNLIFSFVFGVEILEYMYLLFPVIITGAMLAVMTFTSVCLIAMQKRLAMLIGMLAGAVLLSVSVMPATRSGGMLGTTQIFIVSLCLIIIVHGFLIIRNLWRV